LLVEFRVADQSCVQMLTKLHAGGIMQIS